MMEQLTVLLQGYPGLEECILPIRDLREQTTQIRRGPFFEHQSLVVLEGGKPTLAAVGAADFNAWRHHMFDGTSVRMHGLENGVIAELVAGTLTSAMAVARAHMEVAGLATYCCRALYDAGRTGDFAPIEKLILHTYFGSNLRIQVKGTPELDPYLRPEEVRPLRVGELIKSMDAFRSAGDASGTLCQPTYGLLSEFAHPAMRASKAFAGILSENDKGWYIQYHEEDRPDETSVRMALEILVENMRVGHAASALLRLAEVLHVGDTYILRTPSPKEVGDIYVNLLQQPGP